MLKTNKGNYLPMKVSIITVTYNRGKTLADTMQSVLAQTYANIEYIVIDGGSTDNTLQVIEQYKPLFGERLIYVSEPDNGIYDAMNKGIKLSSGDVIGILNSDDFFTSNNVIETLVSSFDNDIEAIYGDIHFVNPNNLNKTTRYYSGKLFRPWLVKYGCMPPHPSFYVRKSIYERFGNYNTNYKIASDFELIARLCYIHNIKTRYISVDMVTMRMGGISTKDSKTRLLILKESIEACKQLGIKTNALKVSCKYFIKSFENIFITKPKSIPHF